MTDSTDTGLYRWRLILGDVADSSYNIALSERDKLIDSVLEQLYDNDKSDSADSRQAKKRQAGLGSSRPRITRWLGDIRSLFPTSVVRILQQDAMEKLNLKQLLLEPEILETVTPDINLVSTILSVKNILPDKARDAAQRVVNKLVEELLTKLRVPMLNAIKGALDRRQPTRHPQLRDIDWNATIRANLRHYSSELHTIIPESVRGLRRQRHGLEEVILLVDQSGSMSESAIYAALFGSVMACIPALQTRMIVFDTAVCDLTDVLSDPVETLFSIQIGGGTDINLAMQYAAEKVTNPQQTTIILISDLYEGGDANNLLKVTARLISSGIKLVALLALSDSGVPAFNEQIAKQFATLGAPAFACTPDNFPSVMADCLNRFK